MIKETDVFMSVIIPYFNTPEKYIVAAVNSVFTANVDGVNTEIIIVDDGSDLKNAARLDEVFSNNEQIRIIHKENGGLPSARNEGMKIANGKYVTFLDDDDYLDENFISDAVKYSMEYKDCKIIIGYMKFEPYGQLAKMPERVCLFNDDNKLELYKCLLNISPRKFDFEVLGSACGRIYLREFILNIGFEESVTLYEDQLYNRQTIVKADSILVVPRIWYHYYQREGSMMHPKDRWDVHRRETTYLSALFSLMQSSDEEIRKLFCFEAFRMADYYGHLLSIDTKNELKNRVNELEEYCKRGKVQGFLREFITQDYVNNKQKVLAHLLLCNQYYLYLILKWIAQRLADIRGI